MAKGKEMAETFQRSSSFVEGRNRMPSLNYHRFHRLNVRSLKVLTIIHNFDVQRSDVSTAAERFFEAKQGNLFESLAVNVRIPGRPKHKIITRKSGELDGKNDVLPRKIDRKCEQAPKFCKVEIKI